MRPHRSIAPAGIALAALGALAVLFAVHAGIVLTADWGRLVARAEGGGMRLDGQPNFAVAWPPQAVLIVRDVRLTERAHPDGPSVRTTALTLAGSPFEPGPIEIRLDRPLIVAAGRSATEMAGEAIVAKLARSGRVEFGADGLRIAIGAGPDDVVALTGPALSF